MRGTDEDERRGGTERTLRGRGRERAFWRVKFMVSWLAQVIICAAPPQVGGRRPERRVGSHRALRGSRRGEDGGVRGLN
jgi:hypothetical protein